ncbi:enoyl-CoA hydratase/isomerase family protein [Sphingosinicella soli]|uniref:Enoyl-CoA hydratase/carnithine racemase n=1 Tax=Sphingosinicella soli TaxID=333708 RepID=A0A7W7B0W7_9SPHN|nr:enoyl-CoA hydratase-related protein [Sphingosinicella soli]MBB4631990.1 enoyl-CoA hydratase/carnithine racemase [Sphingosinicella soli]
MTSQGIIKTERHGGVAIVTLSNPEKRNAFTPDMRRSLTGTLTELNRTVEVRAVVLTGEEKHFCAGADVSAMGAGAAPRTTVQIRENTKEVNHLLQAIVTAPKPYVASVDGDAFGAGMSLAIACDFLVAGPGARFGTAFAKIGLLPDLGMLHYLPLRVGMTAAKRMMMLCEPVLAERAFALGLADELNSESAMVGARALAEKLADGSPLAIGYIKSVLADGISTWQDAMRAELDIGSALAGTEDFKEGIAALREKRPPVYQGR